MRVPFWCKSDYRIEDGRGQSPSPRRTRVGRGTFAMRCLWRTHVRKALRDHLHALRLQAGLLGSVISTSDETFDT